MRHQGNIFRLPRWVALPCAFALMLISLAPVLAQPQVTSGYTFTLTFGNSGPYTSGGMMPTFRGSITVPQGGATPDDSNVVLQVNGQANAVSVSGSSGNTYSTYAGFDTQQSGKYTAVEVFTLSAGTTIQSNILTFTVAAPPAPLSCSIRNSSYVYAQGESLQVDVGSDAPSPSVYQGGTFTLTFTGPTTVTEGNLTVNSNGVVTAPAPARTGNYQMQCAFSGNSSYAPTTTGTTGVGVMVSLEHQIGSVQVYSSPTTLAAQQTADMYVVFHAAGGLPAPTGRFYIEFIRGSSNPIYLQPDGTVLVHLSPLPLISGESHFTLFYVGDPNYNSVSLTFPITNPPIPGGNTGGGGGGTSPTAKAKATATAAPTGTASGGTLAEAGTPASGAVASTPTSHIGMPGGSGFPLWILIAVILVLLGGSAGGILVWRRQARDSVPAVSYVRDSDFTFPQWPPFDE